MCVKLQHSTIRLKILKIGLKEYFYKEFKATIHKDVKTHIQEYCMFYKMQRKAVT